MDQDKKSQSGAPSSDTTSALFVSARKKQLEQQEAEQRAKKKEEERLAAEAEVRRLEAEVEERRRKATEEAKRVEQEAIEETRRIAEESRIKKAEAAENPDAILGTQPQAPKSSENVSSVQVVKHVKKIGRVAGIVVTTVVATIVLLVVWVLLSVNGAPITDTGLDFEGVWYEVYSDGDFNTYTFKGGNKLTIDYYDDTSENFKFKVSGADVTCTSSDSEFTLTVNGETLYDAFNNVLLTREKDVSSEASGNGADDEWTLEPEADMDSLETIAVMAMGVPYPSSQLFPMETETAAEESVTLVTHDGNAIIGVAAIEIFEDPNFFNDENLTIMKDAFIESLSFSDLQIVDQAVLPDQGMAYVEITYSSQGETRFGCYMFKAWVNINNNSNYIYNVSLDCPEDQSDEYMILYREIGEALSDV